MRKELRAQHLAAMTLQGYTRHPVSSPPPRCKNCKHQGSTGYNDRMGKRELLITLTGRYCKLGGFKVRATASCAKWERGS